MIKTEGKKKSRAFLEFRPYSAFTFGGQNRKPKAENFRFRPKVSASGIPLVLISESFFISKKCAKSLFWTPKENMLRKVIWHFVLVIWSKVTLWDQITSTFPPDIFSILIIWIFWSGKKQSMLRIDFNPMCKNIPVESPIFEIDLAFL